MKKITLIFSFLAFSFSLSNAQNIMGKLWGMTPAGGDSSNGVIFNYDSIGAAYTVVKNMPGSDGIEPNGNLIQATDGNFYGLTSSGGTYNNGVIVEWNPITKKETVLHSFGSGIDGVSPYGNLIQAADGNLYGLTNKGGAKNDGVIFEWNTTTLLETVLYSFAGGVTDGQYPYGSLIQAKDGNLYGMTYVGGVNSAGVIFEWNTTTPGETVLYSFGNMTDDGINPRGDLMQAKDGNFYGLTFSGGKQNHGAIFEFNATLLTEDTVYSFKAGATDGSRPYGSLIQAVDGNFYGLTEQGGAPNYGIIFEWNTITLAETELYAFAGGLTDGRNPEGSLMQAKDGNLYGTTDAGGPAADGGIFEWNTTTPGETMLYIFAGSGGDGQTPLANLIQAADGNFYGMTYSGGTADNGTIFEYNTTALTESVLHSFGATPGIRPNASLMQASDGNFYGTTKAGGTNDEGTVFKLTATGAITVLGSFTGQGANGEYPVGDLVQAKDGNLYGMASGGGRYAGGMLFKYDTTAKQVDTLLSFDGVSGSSADGSLVVGNDGNLYGMTTQGGIQGLGNIFEWNTGTKSISSLYGFTGGSADGKYPHGSLILAADGNFYGVTQSGGGSFYGVIFEWNTTTKTETILHSFGGGLGDGEYPEGSLIQAADGNLYGLTNQGGTNNYGVIFEWNTLTQTETVLYNFVGANDGEYPYGSLIQASDGNLYGMARAGGKYGDGTVFQYNITAATLDTLISFNGTNGKTPFFNDLLEAMSTSLSSAVNCSGTALTANVRGAQSPYTFKWSTGATSSTINAKTAGTYSYTVTDARGIKLSASYVVTYDTLGVKAGSIATICSGSPTSLSAAGNGGAGTYTYSWMPGPVSGATPSVSPTTSTVYTVTATDGTCSVTTTQSVTVNQPTTASLTQSACDSLVVNSIVYKSSNTYIQNLTNKAGCDSTLTLNLTINPLPTVGITGTSNITEGSNDVLTATGSATGFVWSDGSTHDTANVVPLGNITYTLTGTDGNGCKDTATFKVTVAPNGVNNLSNSGSTALYPNPTINTVNLTFNMQGANVAAIIKVIDMSGKEVMNETTTIGNKKVTSLDISDLAQGMYFVKIITAGNSQVLRFIKQ
jgi:uncharacterized repeat protein (TIGR03803 family)